MGNLSPVDASDYDPQASDFQPLPAGDYVVRVTSAEVKQTKNGLGEICKLRLDVVQHQRYHGRVLWAHPVVRHQKPQVVEYSRRILTSLAYACKIEKLTDTSQVVGKIVLAKVALKRRSDSGELENEIKAFDRTGNAGAEQNAPQEEQQEELLKPKAQPWS